MNYNIKEEASRIVALDKDGNQAGEVTFSREGENILVIDHTGVEEEHRGEGLAGKLIQSVADKAKNEDLKIKPVCPYAKKQFTENEEYRELVKE